jgi:hypothetical protein
MLAKLNELELRDTVGTGVPTIRMGKIGDVGTSSACANKPNPAAHAATQIAPMTFTERTIATPPDQTPAFLRMRTNIIRAFFEDGRLEPMRSNPNRRFLKT